MGARKMNRKAGRWGPAGSDSRRSGRARGRERRAGPARGPRACSGKTGRGGVGRPVGLAGWRGPSRPSLLWVCFPSLSFSVLFSSPLFDFKFGLKFEFQIGAPYSLKF